MRPHTQLFEYVTSLVIFGLSSACRPDELPSTGTETTSSTSGEGTTTAPTTVTTGAPPAVCEGPLVSIAQAGGTPSGYFRCGDDGIIHRAEAVICNTPAAPSTCIDNSDGGCASNTDCAEKPHGQCQQIPRIDGDDLFACDCKYGCANDTDCPEGHICRCAGDDATAWQLGSFSECIPAKCTQDADCGDQRCGLSWYQCYDGPSRLDCTTPMDDCDGDGECGASTERCVYVSWWESPRWTCDQSFC